VSAFNRMSDLYELSLSAVAD